MNKIKQSNIFCSNLRYFIVHDSLLFFNVLIPSIYVKFILFFKDMINNCRYIKLMLKKIGLYHLRFNPFIKVNGLKFSYLVVFQSIWVFMDFASIRHYTINTYVSRIARIFVKLYI